MSSPARDHVHAPLPTLNPFDGMEYKFSFTIVDDGRHPYYLYNAMTFGSNGITLRALYVVIIDDSPPVTIGYFHLNDKKELMAIIHDNGCGNKFHLEFSI